MQEKSLADIWNQIDKLRGNMAMKQAEMSTESEPKVCKKLCT